MNLSTPRRVLAWTTLCASLGLGGPAPAAAQDEAPRSYALLIGLNEYLAEMESVPRLQFAVPDAEELGAELEKRNWSTRIVTDDEATRNRIVSELVRLAQQTRQQDTVLVYFAGHGVHDTTAGEHTYWLTYTASLARLAVEGIRLSHLLEYVDDIPAERKVLILDHCHSGKVENVAAAVGGPRDAETELQITRDLFPADEFVGSVQERFARGLVVLGSARDEAYEFPDLGHGVFTHGLLEALRDPDSDVDGNGKLSIAELSGRVKGALDAEAAARNITQVPIEIVTGHDLLTWDVLDAALAPGADGSRLRAFLTGLALEVDLDTCVKAMAFQAINRWESFEAQGVPLPAVDQAIVNEVRDSFDLGTNVDSLTKKQMIEDVVTELVEACG